MSKGFSKIEFLTISLSLLLVGFGIVMIYATEALTKISLAESFALRQALWALIGLAGIVALSLFDYGKLKESSTLIYVLDIVLLLAIFVVGKKALGAQRWISMGPFQFQPSEFSKILVIIVLASLFSKWKEDMSQAKQIIFSIAYITPIVLLIVFQPDLGTALVILATLFGMLTAAGIKGRYLLILLLSAYLLAAGAFHFHLLKGYQMKRLVVFLNPNVDPYGSGYNLKQSIIAVGSGGLKGKGLLSGTQSRLNFLPERRTDFIFAVIGEKLGFFGTSILLAAMFLLILRALFIAANSRSFFGFLIAVGIASMWAFQIIVNAGMTIGIMPVTGIPLPFISYGGSSMITNLLAVGLLSSIYGHRFKWSKVT